MKINLLIIYFGRSSFSFKISSKIHSKYLLLSCTCFLQSINQSINKSYFFSFISNFYQNIHSMTNLRALSRCFRHCHKSDTIDPSLRVQLWACANRLPLCGCWRGKGGSGSDHYLAMPTIIKSWKVVAKLIVEFLHQHHLILHPDPNNVDTSTNTAKCESAHLDVCC